MEVSWASQVGGKIGFLDHLFFFFNVFFPTTIYVPHTFLHLHRHPSLLHFLRRASIVSDFSAAGRKERVQNNPSVFGPRSCSSEGPISWAGEDGGRLILLVNIRRFFQFTLL